MNDVSKLPQRTQDAILIVDDAPERQCRLRALLAGEGYTLTVTNSGLGALAQARSSEPDLILLDIGLPDMDGYTVCSTLKCNLKTRDIPVIFLGDGDRSVDQVRVFEVGGADVILMPIERLEVLTRVRHQLEFRSLQQQLVDQNLRLQQEIRRRYHLETERRANRDRWYLALQGSNDGLWDWDIASGAMYFSDRWQEIVGCEPGTLPPLRASWRERVHPSDLEWVLEFVRYHLEGVTPNYYAEYRLRDQSGAYRWVLDRGQAQWDDRGQPIRMSGSLTDVTLRHQSEEQLQLLLVTGQAIMQSKDLEQMFNSVLSKLCQVAEWNVGEAWTLDADLEQLVYCWGTHHCEDDLEQLGSLLAFEKGRRSLLFRQHQGVAGRIWAQTSPLWIEDLAQIGDLEELVGGDRANSSTNSDSGSEFGSASEPTQSKPQTLAPSRSARTERQLWQAAHLRSVHGLPIYADGRVLAVLMFFSLKPRPRDDRVIDLTQAVASQLSSFMLRKQTEQALTRANSELERLATLDGLTQLANRRRFDEYIHTEWRRALRDSQPISMLLCDVDHFKRYNDCYGHQAGDTCLCWVARALQDQANRTSDLAARYGGEEFAIILPNTDRLGAIVVAERAIQAVRDLMIPHEGSSVCDYITVSIGVASAIPPAGTLPTRLIAQADRNLYQAKAKGRNRVCGDP